VTHEEALKRALDELYDVGRALAARRLLLRPHLTPVIRASLQDLASNDEELERRVFGAWEKILVDVEPQLPGSQVFECSPSGVDEP
jgi:hypothetical protein